MHKIKSGIELKNGTIFDLWRSLGYNITTIAAKWRPAFKMISIIQIKTKIHFLPHTYFIIDRVVGGAIVCRLSMVPGDSVYNFLTQRKYNFFFRRRKRWLCAACASGYRFTKIGFVETQTRGSKQKVWNLNHYTIKLD